MPRGLTYATLRDRIARRTGMPRSVVAHVLDGLIREMSDELLGQGEIYLRGLFRLSSVKREFVMPGKRTMSRLSLRVRPVRTFRQRLNRVLPTR